MGKFFVTCGRGFEKFVKDELKSLTLDVENLTYEGKLFFSLPGTENCLCLICKHGKNSDPKTSQDSKVKCKNSQLIQSLFSLKLVERIFFLVLLKQKTEVTDFSSEFCLFQSSFLLTKFWQNWTSILYVWAFFLRSMIFFKVCKAKNSITFHCVIFMILHIIEKHDYLPMQTMGA